MELDYLRVIKELVADPNLTRAAERLHVTQSALSKRVQMIERELNVQLFERRGPRGLRAMPQAMELALLADRVLTAWNTGVKRIQDVAEEPEHFVLVGPEVFLREMVLPWWKTVDKEFPKLQLEVKVSSLSRASIETVQAGADAGILEHKEELADYVCRPIFNIKWGIVRHPSTQHEDLRKYIWGGYAIGDNPVETWLVRRQKMPPPTYRVHWQDLTALALWVSETPGAASVLPWHCIAWLAKRKKVEFEPVSADSTTTLYLAYQKSNPHKRLLKQLAQIGADPAVRKT